jgi:hypothetical protein
MVCPAQVCSRVVRIEPIMINVVIYAVVAVCGLTLAWLNVNGVSLVAGVCMFAIGGVAAVRQYRRVRGERTQDPKP